MRGTSVGAHGVDLLAKLRRGADIDKQHHHKHHDQAHDRHDSGNLAVAKCIKRPVTVERIGHTENRAAVADKLSRDMLACILRKGAIDKHRCQRDDKRRHLHDAYEHTVDQAAQRSKKDSKQKRQRNGIGLIEHHDRESGHKREHRAHGKVDITRKAHDTHANGNHTDHGTVAEHVHGSAQGKAETDAYTM